jgi:hypothetical protein
MQETIAHHPVDGKAANPECSARLPLGEEKRLDTWVSNFLDIALADIATVKDITDFLSLSFCQRLVALEGGLYYRSE